MGQIRDTDELPTILSCFSGTNPVVSTSTKAYPTGGVSVFGGRVPRVMLGVGCGGAVTSRVALEPRRYPDSKQWIDDRTILDARVDG